MRSVCAKSVLVKKLLLENGERTDVLATQTSKKNQIAILALAAGLYGETSAPGTGPLALDTLEIWVVLARALTAHHIANSEIAAARQTKSYGKTSNQSIGYHHGQVRAHTEVTRKF